MTDTDKIALAVALVIIFAAAAFALGIFFRRPTVAGRLPLEGPTAIQPIGFVRF